MLDEEQRARLRPASLPDRVEPMKAVLTEQRDWGESWLLERKLDGIRCVAIKDAHRLGFRPAWTTMEFERVR